MSTMKRSDPPAYVQALAQLALVRETQDALREHITRLEGWVLQTVREELPELKDEDLGMLTGVSYQAVGQKRNKAKANPPPRPRRKTDTA